MHSCNFCVFFYDNIFNNFNLYIMFVEAFLFHGSVESNWCLAFSGNINTTGHFII